MLKMNKTTSFRGESKVGDVTMVIFNASINSDNPEEASMDSYTTNQSLYRANREIANADRIAFEDEVYAFQQASIDAKTV